MARSGSWADFTGFLPAIGKEAPKNTSGEVRRRRLHRQTGFTFVGLARRIGPIVRGRMRYHGAFYRSPTFNCCTEVA